MRDRRASDPRPALAGFFHAARARACVESPSSLILIGSHPTTQRALPRSLAVASAAAFPWPPKPHTASYVRLNNRHRFCACVCVRVCGTTEGDDNYYDYEGRRREVIRLNDFAVVGDRTGAAF